MQDGAPAHSAQRTKRELSSRGVDFIVWPSYSPDLNPIESVWDMMKSHIEEHHPEFDSGNPSEEVLRNAVLEAWESISQEQLATLVESMPERCQAVIRARGGSIPY